MRDKKEFFKKIASNNYLIAFISGTLSALSFAPLHFFLAAFFSLSSFFILLSDSNVKPKLAFKIGWFYGFGYFLAGIYWFVSSLLIDAKNFAWMIPFALSLIPALLALYFALFAFIYKKISSNFKDHRHLQIIIFAILWLLFEFLRGYLFTGFPWNLIGYSWIFSDKMIQLASIFSIYGLSLFAVLVACTPTLFIDFDASKLKSRKLSNPDRIYLILICLFLFADFLYGHLRLKNLAVDSNLPKIRLIQANIKQDLKWDPKTRYENFFKHILLSKSKDLKDIDTIIWSESSVPYVLNNDPYLLTLLKTNVIDNEEGQNRLLITGGLRAKITENITKPKVEQVWNSIYLINQKGIFEFYDKLHLLPFGEYIPFSKLLPFLTKVTGGGVDFSAGQTSRVITTSNFSFIPLICYEAIFPGTFFTIKDFMKADAIINLTNDAWFGISPGPYQHFDMARMRAVEYGIPLIRVANTGISSFVDGWGRVLVQTKLNEEKVLDINLVKKLDKPTLYDLYGYKILILLVGLIIYYSYSTVRKII